MFYENYFKNKKITVMGLGLLGRGVGDVRFLAEQGAEITVTDLKSEEELEESLEKLRGLKNIKYVLGEHRLEDFRDKDFILKAAGVPLDSVFIREARKNGVPVKMSTSLFAKLTPATVVGVTGTRGKSTVTSLIFEILKSSGRKAFLGGNVKGVSTLAHLPESSKDEIAVLELDSWQLQGFGEENISPDVAVFTTFMPDHLNYYGSTGSPQVAMERYFEDKANIFKYQDRHQGLIIGQQARDLIHEKYPEHVDRATIATSEDLPKDWDIKIPGEHNRYNIACAVSVARSLGVSDQHIKRAVEEFKGVEGRLELVKEVRGIKIYNDTTATTPQATLAALRALSESGIKNKELEKESIHNSKFLFHNSARIVLIMGGADKGLDTKELLEEVPKFCKAVVLLPGTGTERIGIRNNESGIKNGELKFEIHNSSFSIQGESVGSLSDALNSAFKYAEKGDFILFSPAFASFGGFVNEFDRGERFINIINSMG